MAQRKILHNLDYRAIMHPDDKKTVDWLNSLRVPYTTNWEFVRDIARHPTDHNIREWYDIFMAGVEYYTFQDFLRVTTSKYREAYNEVENQGEGINITNESLPKMHQQLVDACEILGVKDIPTYSTDWEYAPYHFSNGEFTDEEMMFVLGHELGHMACGHKPYHMLLETFYMPFVNDAAFKAWASIIKLPLMEWYRMSDYTADRMGLLCCQDINAAITTMIKKAGLPKKCYNNIDVQGFIQQAREFEENFTDTMDRVVKVLSIRSAEFPWLVVRAGKLYDWYHSDEYKQIIDNN